jgi:anti-sigma factor RsiW
MIVMRQRLLLVAGWLAAAIGTGLVASGAVAVAGGQVLDRPLSPLTAAEVAALPVVAVGSSENVEPQASGGIDQSTDGPTVGSAESDTDANGSASTGGSADDKTDQSTRWDRFTNPGSSETEVVSLHAGKASFALADDRLHLLWATPGAGYVMNTLSREDTAVIISFSSSRDVWLIEARIVDGSLEVVSGPRPLA